MRIITLSVIPAVLAAIAPGLACAGGPPELDVRQSCRAADRVLAYAGMDKPRADMQACLDDERTAKSALSNSWAGFTAAARTLCVGMNHTGGPPSYVELLTCLEVMRDAGNSTAN